MNLPSHLNDLTLSKDANSKKTTNLYPDQDYHQIMKKCRERKELFEDSRFPANNRLLTDKAGQSIVISHLGRREVRETEIKWLRPQVSISTEVTSFHPLLFLFDSKIYILL